MSTSIWDYPDLTPDDAERVLPLIRGPGDPKDDVGDVKELTRDKTPVADDFVDELYVVYAVDFGEAYGYVKQADLRDLSPSAKELGDKALANLQAKCQQMETLVHSSESGRSNMITIGENLEPSLLMVDALWQVLASEIKGRLVAACPSRDVLVFCDLAVEGALDELREGIARVWANAGRQRISQTLLEWAGDRWTPLKKH